MQCRAQRSAVLALDRCLRRVPIRQGRQVADRAGGDWRVAPVMTTRRHAQHLGHERDFSQGRFLAAIGLRPSATPRPPRCSRLLGGAAGFEPPGVFGFAQLVVKRTHRS
jgi:hypothetical protein